MKKLMIITALVLGLSMSTFANSGLFNRGTATDNSYYGAGSSRSDTFYTPILPYHELETNQPADIITPLTGEMAVLLGFGLAYAFKKRKKE